MEIIIDDKFKNLIPPLTKEEMAQLEENILRDGCLDPLRLWNGNILIDGHHRYEVCMKNKEELLKRHKKLFDTVEITGIETERQAKKWIIRHQLGTRNLSSLIVADLMGLYYELEKEEHGGDRRSQAANQEGKNALLIEGGNRTAKAFAGQHHMDERTVRRNAQFHRALNTIAETVGVETKFDILNGKAQMSKEEVIDVGKQDAEVIKEYITTKQEALEEKEKADKEERERRLAEAKDKKGTSVKKIRRAVKKDPKLKRLDRIVELSKFFKKYVEFSNRIFGGESMEEEFKGWTKPQCSQLYQQSERLITNLRMWQAAMDKKYPDLKSIRGTIKVIR
jgi:hypothetical protein